VTVLGACGAWPTVRGAGSGFLVQHGRFAVLVDAGYAVMPRLQEYVAVDDLDAVLISHGHPDHCVDLNPLLRARVLRDDALPPLDVYAPSGALDAVLALDRPGLLDGGYVLHDVGDERRRKLGPFELTARFLPHWLPNVGVRLSVGGRVFVYTGDCGSSPAAVELAQDADLLLAEASFVEDVPDDSRSHLSSAEQRGRLAAAAGVRRLVLTHLLPGTDPAASAAAARRGFDGDVTVASVGLVLDVGDRDP
jgi:ribonuclease BN (tRNA processing enzyme)